MMQANGSGPYRAWPQAGRSDGVLTLRAVEPVDIEPIRQWRNAQMDVLRQSEPISEDAQVAYFAAHVWPQKGLAHPSQILLTIERAGALIGYGALVNISWPNHRAEISFLLSPDEEAANSRAEIFRRYLHLVQTIAFEDLALARLFTETYAHRKGHIATLEAAGMRPEGCLRHHVVIDGQPTDSLMHGILAKDWKAGT